MTSDDKLKTGLTGIEALGSMALANPDLVARLKQGAPLNEPRVPLFYADGGAEGYPQSAFFERPAYYHFSAHCAKS